MNMYDILAKKRDGGILSKEEINYLVNGYVDSKIPDYQISAWLMAVCINGLENKELNYLTEAMLNSGDMIDLTKVNGITVDKHSTGGVGDKTTLIVAPIVASANVPVAKMSGRGLGFTGGTIDKLEAIPGYQVEIPIEKFIQQVNDIGIAVVGQTGHLVPADKKIYALRDVTGTVESIPLIASSIMSKKLASGADKILLDVKVGSGAFMESLPSAQLLGKTMVEIGKGMGKDTIAIISSMDQPLGYGVGNSIEIIEVVETLKGNGPADLTFLCEHLASYMFLLNGRVNTIEEGILLAQEQISSGSALNKFKELIHCQKGNSNICDDYTLLPTAEYVTDIISTSDGYIHSINAKDVGKSAMLLGAGRETKISEIDLSSGVILEKKVGDYVKKGDCIARMHYNKAYLHKVSQVEQLMKSAFHIKEDEVKNTKLIYDVIN